jgi:O-antigen/teichoic acid export membrane protein
MGLTLFSSRWVLGSLGQTDYGLYSVVGSIIVFVVFVNNVMSGSAARFFAYSIGQGETNEINAWFNVSLSIHICLALILVMIGIPVGEAIIRHVLTIPENRLATCIWVYRISLVSTFVSMMSVPFMAMFTAKQYIAELAIWGLLQTVFSFCMAWILHLFNGDKLLIYSFGMVGILVFVQGVRIYRGFVVFQECKVNFKHWLDRERMKRIFSFSSWSLIGSLGVTLRDQGSAILLNVFFGPQVNAAYGIASQVSAQTNQLSSAMVGAFSPEITACEGRGDRPRMIELANKASKFGTFLILIFAFPLIVEMDYVLKIWLHTPPPLASILCRLILIAFMIDRLGVGPMLAINASGKIAIYQAVVGACMIFTIPLGWVLFKFGAPPKSIGLVFILTMSAATMFRIVWGKHLLGMSIARWWSAVLLPNLIIVLAMSGGSTIIVYTLPPSLWRLGITCILSVTIAITVAWLWVFDGTEKQRVLSWLKKKRSRA